MYKDMHCCNGCQKERCLQNSSEHPSCWKNRGFADDAVDTVTKIRSGIRSSAPGSLNLIRWERPRNQQKMLSHYRIKNRGNGLKVSHAQKCRDLSWNPSKALSLLINRIVVPQSSEGATWYRNPRWSEIGAPAGLEEKDSSKITSTIIRYSVFERNRTFPTTEVVLHLEQFFAECHSQGFTASST